MSTSFGSTVTPGRTCCRPLTITRSPGFRPSVIFAQAVVKCSQPDGAGDHLVLLVDDVEDLLALVGVEGAVADQQALVWADRWEPGRGRKARGGGPGPCWGTRPAPVWCRSSGLTWLSTKLIGPPVWVALLVGQAQRTRGTRRRGASPPCLRGPTAGRAARCARPRRSRRTSGPPTRWS